MSLIKTNRTTDGVVAVGARAKDRAKDAAVQAVPLGKRAGTTAAQGVRQGVQGAKEWTAPRIEDVVQSARPRIEEVVQSARPRIEDAVQSAREWAAPRLEGAADAVTTTVAPKVSTALRTTASQVRPDGAKSRSGLRKLLNWRWLLGIGAVLTAAGATTAITMRRRYEAATAAANDATETPDGEGTPAPGEPGSEEAKRAAEVNGQITTART